MDEAQQNGNGIKTAIDARLVLAFSALAAYMFAFSLFSYWPPKLSGDQSQAVLSTLGNLTVVAFMYYFHKTNGS